MKKPGVGMCQRHPRGADTSETSDTTDAEGGCLTVDIDTTIYAGSGRLCHLSQSSQSPYGDRDTAALNDLRSLCQPPPVPDSSSEQPPIT